MYLSNHRFSKYHQNILIEICPGRFYKLVDTCLLFWLFSRWLCSGECITYLVWITFQGRNLSNCNGILENQCFHKYILTSSDLYQSLPQRQKTERIIILICSILFWGFFEPTVFFFIEISLKIEIYFDFTKL